MNSQSDFADQVNRSCKKDNKGGKENFVELMYLELGHYSRLSDGRAILRDIDPGIKQLIADGRLQDAEDCLVKLFNFADTKRTTSAEKIVPDELRKSIRFQNILRNEITIGEKYLKLKDESAAITNLERVEKFEETCPEVWADAKKMLDRIRPKGVKVDVVHKKEFNQE